MTGPPLPKTGALTFTRLAPEGHTQLLTAPPLRRGAVPLVSCLMVTRGVIDILKFSVECFLRQNYPNRELLICGDDEPRLAAFLETLGRNDIRIIPATAGLSLGELRNVLVSHAAGEVVCNWDDDDLYDPRRIMRGIRILAASDCSAVFLSRWLFWWPARRSFALPGHRPWEGSMLAWRDEVGSYPPLALGEDYVMVEAMRKQKPIALLDEPGLYCKTFTGVNAFGEDRFAPFFVRQPHIVTGPEHEALLGRLAKTMPIREYCAALEALGTA